MLICSACRVKLICSNRTFQRHFLHCANATLCLLPQAPQASCLAARCTAAEERQPWPACSASTGNSFGSSPLRMARPSELQRCRTATPSSVPPLETQGPGGGTGGGDGSGGSRGFSGDGAGEGDEEETLLTLEQVCSWRQARCRIICMAAWRISMEGYPGTSALLVMCCCQAELIAGAQGVKLPKEFVAAASGAGLRSNALQQYMKLQASTHLQTATHAHPLLRCLQLLLEMLGKPPREGLFLCLQAHVNSEHLPLRAQPSLGGWRGMCRRHGTGCWRTPATCSSCFQKS